MHLSSDPTEQQDTSARRRDVIDSETVAKLIEEFWALYGDDYDICEANEIIDDYEDYV